MKPRTSHTLSDEAVSLRRAFVMVAVFTGVVVLMGGGAHVGNWSAVAEFNIVIDPEAAAIVFNEPWLVTMVGLDLTHQALATPEVRAAINAVGTGPSKFVDEHAVCDLVEVGRRDGRIPLTRQRPLFDDVHDPQERGLDEVVASVGKPMGAYASHGAHEVPPKRDVVDGFSNAGLGLVEDDHARLVIGRGQS